MNWIQQAILWAALPLSVSLVVAAVSALRAVVKSQAEGHNR